jgi:hypothetical protein
VDVGQVGARRDADRAGARDARVVRARALRVLRPLAISFLIILPIALPGIVTGMALNATFTQVLEVDLALLDGRRRHATFCVVMVFNNVVARLRRTRHRSRRPRPTSARAVADVPRW